MELSNFIIQETSSILDAAAKIDNNSKQIVFVCNGMKLIAAFTDGDLRRCLLRTTDLTQPVGQFANKKPVFVKKDEQYRAKKILFSNPYLRGVPIVDVFGDIVSIEFPDSAIRKKLRLNIPVVIMAGGKGTRLAPYTDVLPKPLIPVGEMTITEHIMNRFIEYGCDNFTMIVNHKKGLIKAYFNETPCRGSLCFVDEENFQGTGGGLKLLEGKFDDTFFMTNCDILIEADYGSILKHHKRSNALITMVCALKKVSVPYGTIEMDENGVPIRLVEKPEYPLLTNTGLYVIEPSFLDIIPVDKFIHITDLIQQLMDEGKPVGIYPISETSWLDMGQFDELKKMTEMLSY
jgi:dTDP-glucose pyrophosphorylase